MVGGGASSPPWGLVSDGPYSQAGIVLGLGSGWQRMAHRALAYSKLVRSSKPVVGLIGFSRISRPGPIECTLRRDTGKT